MGEQIKIEKLRVCHLENPLGFGLDKPGFSWVASGSAGKRQTAARVEVSLDPGFTRIVHDSGAREDISSLGYCPELSTEPCTRYYWRVTVWDDAGGSGVSGTAWFETAKQDRKWEAAWIEPPFEKDVHPLFYKRFPVKGPVASARAYVCGLGVFDLYLNGKREGGEVLAPFYNDYNNWLQYVTYDITEDIRVGSNAVGASLGNGWYKGRFGFIDGLGELYGDRFRLICEIRLVYRDGSHEVIGTDGSWLCHPSAVLESSIYDGEVYDARLELPDAFTPQNPLTGYKPALPAGCSTELLKARLSPPLGVCRTLPVRELLYTPAGEWVLDFGQIMTGWFVFRCREAAGTRITVSCGEILQDGCFYNENLRTAKERFVYISDGRERLARPRFTFYGFRYLKVEGMGKPDPQDFCGWVIHSGLEDTGEIETSNEKVNKLFQNIKWGQKGNFVDVPTDCPQRDERMGWTGDAEIFAATACYNMYTPAFFHKYLYDMLREQQTLKGSVPHVVPDILGQIMRVTGQEGEQSGSCAWGDAACVIPWTLYLFYGDLELLRQHYPNMKLWLEYIKSVDEELCGGGRLWKHGFHYADWLALDRSGAEDCVGGTDPYYVASAYYYYSACLTAGAADALGMEEDARRYGLLAGEVREAIRKEYFREDGSLKPDTQTAHVLALHFGFAPPGARPALLKRLEEKLRDKGMHLDTGFVGTPYLCPVLSENGRNECAYTLLCNEDYPSWLYEVNMGATTVWERWDSVLPDGHISDTGMNSLNHYAYGSIAEWMYGHMCGLRPHPKGAGFKRAVLAPKPDRRFSWVRMRYASAAGLYRCGWSIEGEEINFRLEIPFDAEAVFRLPEGFGRMQVNGEARAERELVLEAGSYEITARAV